METKTLRDLIVVFKENTNESVSILLDKIEIINEYNREKYKKTRVFCTDIIDSVDLMSLSEIAQCFDARVDLPCPKYKYTRVSVSFCWGSIILVCNDTGN